MTSEEAIKLAESEFWKELSFYDRAKFQLFEDKLCMPFDVFHEAISKALGRDVWIHEFAFRDQLIAEFLGDKPAPTMDDIINLIPKDKRVVVLAGASDAEATDPTLDAQILHGGN